MNQTEKIIEVGDCRVRIYGTEIQTATGPVTIRNAALQRTYRGRDGNMGTAYSFRENDIPKAIMALTRAYEFIISKQAEIKREKESGQEKLGGFGAGG